MAQIKAEYFNFVLHSAQWYGPSLNLVLPCFSLIAQQFKCVLYATYDAIFTPLRVLLWAVSHPCLLLRGSSMCCWGHSVVVWHSSVCVPPLNLVPSHFFIYCLTVQICAVCDIRCLLTQIQSADSTLLNLARPFLSVIQLKNRLYAQQNRARAAEQPLLVRHDTQKF